MKPSEIRLVEMLNRNNHMRIDSTRVSFGSPVISGDRRYNTWIETFANPDDKQYGRSTTTAYNRLDSRELGDNSVIEINAYSLASVVASICSALLLTYNIPCSPSEITIATSVKLTEDVAVVVFDFNNHPLVFGSATAKVKLGVADLSTVITNTDLSGFTPDDVMDKPIVSELTNTRLMGFAPEDVR